MRTPAKMSFEGFDDVTIDLEQKDEEGNTVLLPKVPLPFHVASR